MKKVILEPESPSRILLGNVSFATPIFAVRNGKIVGLVIQDLNHQWSIGFGDNYTKVYNNREDLIKDQSKHYEFIIDITIIQPI